jgi:diguanylate cyclase (GGDEF)-like protein
MDASIEAARRAFAADPLLLAIPVTGPSGAVTGVIPRETLAANPGAAADGSRRVKDVMSDRPLIIDASTSLDVLGTKLLNRREVRHCGAFVVTRGRRYVGVGTGLDLIRVLTQRRSADLERMADHDMLTGLANRALFEQRLARALAESSAGESVAVVFIDLDRFKEVNDTYGRRFGDLVLTAVGQRVRAAVRKTDTVARLSGDEFALVLPGMRSGADAETVARLVFDACGAPLAIDGQEVVVSGSIGLAISPHDGTTAEGLLRAADTAQFHAKEVRNSLQRYRAEMDEWRRPLPGLMALHHALEQGEVDVHYQPIASVTTRRLVGVEALVRWTHPAFGPIPASDVVRLAEDSGLIVALSEHVMRSSLEQVRAWDEATGRTDLRLSVNVSAVQVHEGGLGSMIDRLLTDFRFDPRRLDLELTERVAMRASASTMATLHHLRARGITLTLDDFGTGYSSLSRLERLPIDAMKIDRSFLDGVAAPDGGVIARAIIAMGRSLGLRIVGEGVETPEQLAFLEAQGCDFVQGYLLSAPMSGDALLPLLRAHQPLRSVRVPKTRRSSHSTPRSRPQTRELRT